MTFDWQTISACLYELDPMQTSCQENDCIDEYHFVAKHIVKNIEQGLMPSRAIYLSLMQLFDEESAKSVDVDELARLIRSKGCSVKV